MRSLRTSSPLKVLSAVVAAACVEKLLFPETDGVPGIVIMLSLTVAFLSLFHGLQRVIRRTTRRNENGGAASSRTGAPGEER